MDTEARHAPFPLSSGLKQPYHLVDPSPWPIVGALGGGLTVLGIIFAAHFGNYIVLVLGVLIVLRHDVLLVARRAAGEPGARRAIAPIVRLGLRYGMALFIASEVMFFVGFFWAYFNFALFPDTPGQRPDGLAARRTFTPSIRSICRS